MPRQIVNMVWGSVFVGWQPSIIWLSDEFWWHIKGVQREREGVGTRQNLGVLCLARNKLRSVTLYLLFLPYPIYPILIIPLWSSSSFFIPYMSNYYGSSSSFVGSSSSSLISYVQLFLLVLFYGLPLPSLSHISNYFGSSSLIAWSSSSFLISYIQLFP